MPHSGAPGISGKQLPPVPSCPEGWAGFSQLAVLSLVLLLLPFRSPLPPPPCSLLLLATELSVSLAQGLGPSWDPLSPCRHFCGILQFLSIDSFVLSASGLTVLTVALVTKGLLSSCGA